MIITYDENNRRINLAKHGMDFADITPEFFDSAFILEAKAGRMMAINVFIDGIVTVIFATLGTQGISIISMRAASKLERTLYE